MKFIIFNFFQVFAYHNASFYFYQTILSLLMVSSIFLFIKRMIFLPSPLPLLHHQIYRIKGPRPQICQKILNQIPFPVNGAEEEAAADDEVKGITGSGTGEELAKENGEMATSDTWRDGSEDKNMDTLAVEENQDGHSLESRSSCISPASSQGGVYSVCVLRVKDCEMGTIIFFCRFYAEEVLLV